MRPLTTRPRRTAAWTSAPRLSWVRHHPARTERALVAALMAAVPLGSLAGGCARAADAACCADWETPRGVQRSSSIT